MNFFRRGVVQALLSDDRNTSMFYNLFINKWSEVLHLIVDNYLKVEKTKRMLCSCRGIGNAFKAEQVQFLI